MDRWRWCPDEVETRGFGGLGGIDEETLVLRQSGVRLYDGPNSTAFNHGQLQLTSHRILWSDTSSLSGGEYLLGLPLAAVVDVRVEEGGGLVRNRTPKLVLKLLTPAALNNVISSLTYPPKWSRLWTMTNSGDSSSKLACHPGAVVAHSSENYIKLGFTKTGHHEFYRSLKEVLQAKLWTVTPHASTTTPRIHGTGGIGAIERQLAARAGATDRNIAEAFNDLDQLMARAGDMVNLSRGLSKSVRESKVGEVSSDETAQLRSAMLSMGVIDQTIEVGQSDSVTTGNRSSSFHVQLAKQICTLLTPLLQPRDESNAATNPKSGIAGCLDLASTYCRVNRARGMQLVSPEDILRACHLMQSEQLPLRLKRFPSGLLALQLAQENEEETLRSTEAIVSSRQSITADELARIVNLAPLLVKERLLAAEEAGLICRDDTEAGLRFYPNLFATKT